jgi:hypothetical protein
MPHPRAPLPPAELALLARLADELGNGLKRIAEDYVAGARAGGATWREIRRAFGVAPQTAHQRFSPRPSVRRRPDGGPPAGDTDASGDRP